MMMISNTMNPVSKLLSFAGLRHDPLILMTPHPTAL
jgi:hypothetical protein